MDYTPEQCCKNGSAKSLWYLQQQRVLLFKEIFEYYFLILKHFCKLWIPMLMPSWQLLVSCYLIGLAISRLWRFWFNTTTFFISNFYVLTLKKYLHFVKICLYYFIVETGLIWCLFFSHICLCGWDFLKIYPSQVHSSKTIRTSKVFNSVCLQCRNRIERQSEITFSVFKRSLSIYEIIFSSGLISNMK